MSDLTRRQREAIQQGADALYREHGETSWAEACLRSLASRPTVADQASAEPTNDEIRWAWHATSDARNLPDDERAIEVVRKFAHPAPQAVTRDALEALLKHYLNLVNSGDAGFWDPEEEDEVKAARAALRDQS